MRRAARSAIHPAAKLIPEEVPPWDTVRRTREMKPIARPTARVESSGEDRTEKHEAKSEVMPDALKKESEGAASGGEVPPSDGQKSGAFYSAEEVRALLQSEGDRRVSGARRKWEKEAEEAIAGEASKRAAELTASLEAERERLCAELEGERERSRQRERELEIVRLLGERDLPATLLPLIMPARDCAEAVGALADTVAVLASRETKRRLSSDAPKAAEKGIKFTSEELRTIPVARLQEMLGAQ